MKWQTTERYFRNQLAQTLGIPMVGKIFFAADTGTQYEEWLRDEMDVPAELLHVGAMDALVTAHDEMTAMKNDVLIVTPGQYANELATGMTWSKNGTHLVGCALPSREYRNAVGGQVQIAGYSTSGVKVFHNTSWLSSFSNVGFHQYGQAGTALTAFNEAGGRSTFNNCYFEGLTRSQTAAIATASCFTFDHATQGSAGKVNTFNNCAFGDSGQPVRTGTNGLVLVYKGSAGSGETGKVHFNHCNFEMRAADVDPCAILIEAQNYLIGRQWKFEECNFYNFVENHGATKPAVVISDGCSTTHDITLIRCTQQGFTAWTDNATHCFVDCGPTNVAAGGVAVAAV